MAYKCFRYSHNGILAPSPPVKVGWNPGRALQASAKRQTIRHSKTSITIKNRDKLNLRPQLQFLTLDCWQYAALANWVKEVKLDISAVDNRLTALASRSLSATSAVPGSGVAPTEVKRSVAARRKVEVAEEKAESILDGHLK